MIRLVVWVSCLVTACTPPGVSQTDSSARQPTTPSTSQLQTATASTHGTGTHRESAGAVGGTAPGSIAPHLAVTKGAAWRLAVVRNTVELMPQDDNRKLRLVWQWVELKRSAAGLSFPDGTKAVEGRFVPSADTDRPAWLQAPPRRVALIGAHGLCEARVVHGPWVDVFKDAAPAAAFTYVLEGCTGTQWSPLALIIEGGTAPQLSWSPAVSTVDWSGPSIPKEREGEHGIDWSRLTHPDGSGSGSTTWKLQVRKTQASDPPITEVVYGWVTNEATCDVPFDLRTHLTFGATNENLPCPSPSGECFDYWLIGALTLNRKPQGVIVMDRYYGLHWLDAPGAIPHQSELTEWQTGSYHDEQRLPERRFGESCGE